jgi:1-acyl-sn-glycerol-3-phosphate acyltransferase
MDPVGQLIRYSQIAELLAISGYHHLFKLAGNLIDEEEGVIEQHISQLLARRILRHLEMEVEVTGTEHVPVSGRYCVVSTHASYLDWAVLLGYFPSPLRFIAKKELVWIPVIGSYLKLRGVLIDRSRGRDAKRAIRAAVEDGLPWPILIFPEGTRTPDGSIQPFRTGGLRILAEAGLTMVPVCIQGTFDGLSRHAKYIKKGLHLRMAICEPVGPGALGVDRAMKEVERRIRDVAGQSDG